VKAFLLTLLLALVQGIPALPGQTGTVTGVLRTAAGEPAARVRVSAMVPPESAVDVRSVAAFTALAETDTEGRYRLEGIPQGRFYIVAGRVDQPTYYPGTTETAKARIVSISPGGVVSGIDFVVMDSSVRSIPAGNDFAALFSNFGQLNIVSRLFLPVQVTVDGRARLPVFSSAGFPRVQLTEMAGGAQIAIPLNGSSFGLSFAISQNGPEYRVSVENLPEGYAVKSMTFGADDVMRGTLKIPQVNLPHTVVSTRAGITQQVISQASPTGAPMPTLTITLSNTNLSQFPGVRVSGRTKDTEVRSVYLSGVPGTLYSDGTFEFRGVLPGLYLAASPGNRSGLKSIAAIIVVGDRDLEGIELQESAMLPMDVNLPSPPRPSGIHAPGSVVPLASFRGRAIEESSGKPIEEGIIKLIGRDEVIAAIGTGGQFEFSKLPPGSYSLEMQIFGHSSTRRTVVIGEEDLVLDVTSLRLY